MPTKRHRGWWKRGVIFLAVFCTTGAVLAASLVRLRWEQLYEPSCGGWPSSLDVSPHDPKRVRAWGDRLGVGLSEDGGDSWQAAFSFSTWPM